MGRGVGTRLGRPVRRRPRPGRHRDQRRRAADHPDLPRGLSSPSVSGSTATYHAGGDVLRLTVTPQGGVTESLTLPAAQARDPLASTRAAFLGTWHATTPAAGKAFAVTPAVTTPVLPVAPARPGRATADTADTDAATAQDAITTTMHPDCTPSASDGTACSTTSETGGTWDETEQWQDGNEMVGDDLTISTSTGGTVSGLPIGNDDYGGYGSGNTCDSDPADSCLAQPYFKIPMAELNSGMYPYSATLYATETGGSDDSCTDQWSIALWQTDPITPTYDTWDSHPGNIAEIGSSDNDLLPAFNPASYNTTNQSICSASVPISFNVTSDMQDVTENGSSDFNVKLVGDQGTSTAGDPAEGPSDACTGGDNGTQNGLSDTNYNCGFMYVDDDPEIITNYDLTPPAPTLHSITPALYDAPGDPDTSCGMGAQTAYINQASTTLGVTVAGNWSNEGDINADFTLEDADGNFPINNQLKPGGSGTVAGTVEDDPESSLANGDAYYWIVDDAVDGDWDREPVSGGPVLSDGDLDCGFVVDTSAPNPSAIAGDTVNSNGSVTLTLAGTETQPTSCGFSPCFDSGVYEFEYNENSDSFPNTFPTSCTASTPSAPSDDGCVLAGGLSSSSPSGPSDDTTGTQIISTATLASQGSSPSISLCLTDASDSSSTGNPVQVSPCTSSSPSPISPSQDWTFDYAPRKLQLAGTSVCLEATGDGTSAGTTAEIEPCSDDSPGEEWTQGAYGSWVNVNSGLCLTAPSATAGTQLELADCATKDTPLQDWSDATATITVPAPASWGVNTIYLKAETTAGVPTSSYTALTYWVPPPTAPGAQGDVTGDAIPDILATGSNGDLYVYPGTSGSDALSGPEPPAPPPPTSTNPARGATTSSPTEARHPPRTPTP